MPQMNWRNSAGKLKMQVELATSFVLTNHFLVIT
jgi:hypothetical protein